ncbi:hypothetical protein CK203_082838 [Vitis vinifera]|uniref:Disease resistance protein n=1 Tax=Vitis vinifera TaxID=29760 RepID=A0A438DXZ9_VITVI|nr:hypothetical protein CK203_082838 [Vitis vinifera]
MQEAGREENIEPEVEKWLTVVEKVTGDVEKLEDEVKKSSSNGWCSDWTSRYWLSRELKKTTLSIARLQEEGKFSKVSYSAPSPGIESLPTGIAVLFRPLFSYESNHRVVEGCIGFWNFMRRKKLGRAGRLRERLKTEKRVLVILDDVWERLDLGAIGIPHGVDHRG